MVLAKDVVLYNIAKCSEAIHELKKEAVNSRYYLTPAIEAALDGQPLRPVRSADITFRHIEPRHPEWKRYQALKREATIWLAARRRQKYLAARNTVLYNGTPLWREACRRVDVIDAFLRLGVKTERFQVVNTTAEGASRPSFGIEKVTTFSPKQYAEVEKWAKEREARYEAMSNVEAGASGE